MDNLGGADGLPEPGDRLVCGAKNRNGNPCGRSPAAGRKRCRLHGGSSRVGPAHHRYKHGRYSRLLPKGLRGDLAVPALPIEDPLSVREEIALIQVRIGQILSRLKGPVSTSLWPRLCKAMLAFEGARDGAARSAARHALSELIRQGARDEETWDDIHHMSDLKAKMIWNAHRRQVDLLTMIPRDHVTAFAAAMCRIMLASVQDDKEALARMWAELDVLWGGRPRHGATEGLPAAAAAATTVAGGVAEPSAGGSGRSADKGGGDSETGGVGGICGAQNREGKQCQKPPAAGRTRCRLHGGATPRGPRHPRFEHGFYSKALPKGLREVYGRLSSAAKLLSLRDDIALARHHLCLLWIEAQGRDAALLWPEVHAALIAFEAAHASPDLAAQQATGQALAEIIRRGAAEESAWEQIAAQAIRVGKLCAREWRRMRIMGEMLTSAEALTLITMIGNVATRNIRDLPTRTRVADEILALAVATKKRWR